MRSAMQLSSPQTNRAQDEPPRGTGALRSASMHPTNYAEMRVSGMDLEGRAGVLYLRFVTLVPGGALN
jgi:hypothetical protein